MKSFFAVLLIAVLSLSFGACGNSNNGSTSSTVDGSSSHNSSKDNSAIDLPITKNQYNQINIGMTNKDVEKILGKVSDGNISKLDNNKYQWNYSDKDLGLAYITFSKKTNIVIEKSEIGLLSDNSNTITNKTGTRNDNSSNSTKSTNDDYTNYVQSDIEDAIGSTVDWSLTKQVDTVKKIEVNDNLGKKDGSKLILLHLNAPVEGTNNAIKKSVNTDTLKIAKAIMEDTSSLDFKKDSIIYFWYLPLTNSYGKTRSCEAYKISLESNTLKQIDFKHINDVDLPVIADQYNVLYKE